MRQFRTLLWGGVALAALLLGWLWWRDQAAQQGPAAPATAASAMPVGIGGPFTLTGADGKPFSSHQLAGAPYAMFFGFTHCPDVCPTTLSRLTRLRQQLGKGDQAFRIIFISVDPERDTPADVGRYAQLFNTPIIGLTGTSAQIDAVKKNYGIFAQKVPLKDGGYTVDHSATVLLFDRNGKFDSTIAFEEGDGPALDKLKRIAG